MPKEKFKPGTKVWVRCFNYRRTLGEAPAKVVGATRRGKLVFRRWNPRLKRYIKYNALPEHIIRRRN